MLLEEYTVGRKLTVFFGVLIGAFGLSQLGDAMGKIATAQTAAFCVFEVIDRVPPIDTHSTSGASVKDAKGSVEFRNVSFTYPAREEQGVLKNVSFSVEYGKTTALCGQSGCGKSTCVQLGFGKVVPEIRIRSGSLKLKLFQIWSKILNLPNLVFS